MRTLALLFLLGGCGVPVAESTPDSGSNTNTADAGLWCAPSTEGCLADGWNYDAPGRCCLSRQTCKGKDAGTMGYCEY